MSFLDNLKSQIDGLDKEALKAKLGEVSDELSVESIKARYEASGLSDKVTTWVDQAKENVPTTVDEVKAAWGPKLEEMAIKTGDTVEEVAAKIAEILPKIVNKLTK